MSWLTLTVLFIPFALLWYYLRHRKPPVLATSTMPCPLPVKADLIGWLKAALAWVFLFSRTFAVAPGIYYLGQHKSEAPLLVTGNFYLTLFALARHLGNIPVRILVIDTGGINVWCSAGKGIFSAKEIIAKLKECRLQREGEKTRIILPKFSLSGVHLKELRQAGIIPVIGPLYADDLPAYLAAAVPRNYLGDTVRFGLKERLYSALPTAVQFLYYFWGAYVISLGHLGQAYIGLAVFLAFSYPLLFPYLPGKLFATKGIALGLAASLVSFLYLLAGGGLTAALWPKLLFFWPTAVFVALSYTGNSPISNYSSVRREISRFLPPVVGLYLVVLVLEIIY